MLDKMDAICLAKFDGAIRRGICYNNYIYTVERCTTMEELLRILEKNARMPIEDIAAMLDKTPEEIAAMMDEAAAKGYIRG